MKSNKLCTCVLCAGNEKTNRAGLLIIDKHGMLYLLTRKHPYSKKTNSHRTKDIGAGANWREDSDTSCISGSDSVYENFKITFNSFNLKRNRQKYKNLLFWEKIQIPRGYIQNNESALQCAMREFYEETNMLPHGQCYLYSKFLTLEWLDESVVWKYTIYIMFAEYLYTVPSNLRVEIVVEHVKKIVEKIIVKYNSIYENMFDSKISIRYRKILQERGYFEVSCFTFKRYKQYILDIIEQCSNHIIYNNYTVFLNEISDLISKDKTNCIPINIIK